MPVVYLFICVGPTLFVCETQKPLGNIKSKWIIRLFIKTYLYLKFYVQYVGGNVTNMAQWGPLQK